MLSKNKCFVLSKNITKLVEDLTDNIKINDYEILFIDDDSEDGTEKILKDLNWVHQKLSTYTWIQ